MNLLALDAATRVLSLALSVNDETWYFEVDAGLRHSELAMDGVDMLLHRAGIVPRELSAVLCMEGPGSFTGLRIGFSIAKGLSLALGIPFLPVPSLDCMSLPFAYWPGIVLPAIDARGGSFFCALYRDGKRLCADMDAEPGGIARAIAAARAGETEGVLLTGPDAEKLYSALAPDAPPPCLILDGTMRRGYGKVLLDIAKNTEIFNNKVRPCAGPEYIRKSDAEYQL